MPNFRDIYGKDFKELVIVSSLERIETHLERLNGKTKRIDRIDKLTWAGTIIMPLLIGWLSWLTKSLLGR